MEALSTLQSTVASNSVQRPSERHFYLWMAGVFVLVAFGGFTPTYWGRVASGTFNGPPILHIHGALLFSWTLFYLIQAAWIASGHTPTHRAWGLAGIALFSVMMCSILVAQIAVMRLYDVQGYGDAGRRFAAVALCGLPVLIGFFSLAIANVRRPETHKRLMYLIMVGFMHPAIARVFVTFFAPPGGARTAAGVRCGATGLNRRSADRRSHDLRLANTGTAASRIRLWRSDSLGRPVGDRTRFRDSNLDEHRQIPRGTRGLRRSPRVAAGLRA